MNLKAYLATIGMTCGEFAEKLDVSGSYFSQIAKGNILPSRRLARQIEKLTEGQVKVSFSMKTKKVQLDEQKKLKKAEEDKEVDLFDLLYEGEILENTNKY